MKIIGHFQNGDRVQATSKEDGTQHGTVISTIIPKELKGTELMAWRVFCCVLWDNKFTNAKMSISIDNRIFENMNGNETITFSPQKLIS